MAFLKIESNSSASFGGVEYKSDASGVVEIPNEFAEEAASHGEIVPEPVKPDHKADASKPAKGDKKGA